jgi:S1/P1 Nuclease
MNIKKTFFLVIILLSNFLSAKAWGPVGHAIVGRLAMRFVKDDVRQNILGILGKMPIDTAANWMDIMKSNQDFEFMRPWHYVNFPKGQNYIETNKDNSINRLYWTYNDLKHKNVLCDEQIRFGLYVILHLMGDLHMPLHNGFADDIGGNKVMVQYDTLKNHNLHWFWDEDIIRLSNITEEGCLKYFDTKFLDTMKTVDFEAWMYESRSYLDQVYDFPGFELNEAYLQKNKVLVEQQLLKAGLRLAFVLNTLFSSPGAVIDFSSVLSKYRNGIDVKDAPKYIGKKVTICSRVYSLRSTPTITQISVGDRYPKNPLTIVIFGKSYTKFRLPIDVMYKEKNICIKGTIEMYQGKPQIIVEDPSDIYILE